MRSSQLGIARPRAVLCAAIAAICMAGCGGGGKYETMVVIGDSVSHGFQSGTVFYATQPNSYANLMAHEVMARAADDFQLPLLTLPLPPNVTHGARRIEPSVRTLNLGVSGANVNDVLHARATATSPTALLTELDRVLYPRTGTVLEAAIAADPDLIVVFIGNNDALGAVTRVGQIDGASGLTPVAQFRQDYDEMMRRLSATGADIVVGTIPRVTDIAFLVPGTFFQMPASVGVPAPVALGVLAGTLPPEALAVPGNVLTPDEAMAINAHIAQLNEVIRAAAQRHGAAVADVNAFFANIVASQPITIPGTSFRLSAHYAPAFSPTGTSGGFSLDGVHPSNTGHALLANEFISAINRQFDKDFHPVDVAAIAYFDPYLDKDGDGCIVGPGFFPRIPGVIGDSNDFDPATNECRRAPAAGSTLRLPMSSPLDAGGWSRLALQDR
jgi:lysophospholipase L1-like esterase